MIANSLYFSIEILFVNSHLQLKFIFVYVRKFSMEEMLKRTPEGLETPKYSVLDRKSTWEVILRIDE